MKLATSRCSGHETVGIVSGDAFLPVDSRGLGCDRLTMLDLIERFDELLPHLRASTTAPIALGETELLAPIPRPARNILCVGKNYRPHSDEFERSGFDRTDDNAAASGVPDAPIVFTKPPEAVIAHGASIRLPIDITRALDYEAELAVVIARGGRRIAREDAHRHVFGYTIVNDVTARDLQSRHRQWFLGKALDSSCPMGPWITTHDEAKPLEMRIRCWVNGELRQDAAVADLVFDVPTLIAAISAGTTLIPGDIIATGTPAGVGIGFEPARFLVDGDRIDIEVSGIGMLTNIVKEEVKA